MPRYTPAADFVGWLFDWQSLIGSLIAALVALIAIRWAARQFLAADQQAATAAARALRDQLSEYEALMSQLDVAQSVASKMMTEIRNFPNIGPAAAHPTADRLQQLVNQFNEARIRLRERSGFVESPAQTEFDNAAFDFFSLSNTALLQLQLHGQNQPQPVVEPALPAFPHGTVQALDRLFGAFALAGVDLRIEMRDDVVDARRQISRFMQKAVGR